MFDERPHLFKQMVGGPLKRIFHIVALAITHNMMALEKLEWIILLPFMLLSYRGRRVEKSRECEIEKSELFDEKILLTVLRSVSAFHKISMTT